jgi:uncharacterized protein DUF6602
MKENNSIMADQINLGGLFEGLQKQMLAQLSTNREFIEHPGSKGDSLEMTWIEWLRKYLPNRYCVDKAIIIDHKGNISHQIDLVIYDQQFTPFVLTQNGVHYIPAEGVYAIFEVKPDLNGTVGSLSYIEYAGQKIASVRALHRTSTNIIDRGESRNPRPLTKILGGILTSGNTMVKKETWEEKIKACTGIGGIDLGCAVDFGTFIVDHEGEENDKITDFNQRITEYYQRRTIKNIIYSAKERSLIGFFFQLTRYLQQSIGTIAAIDLNAYSAAIGFDLDNRI